MDECPYHSRFEAMKMDQEDAAPSSYERIVAARMKGVAFEEPDQGQVSPFEYPVFFKGVAGIGGAGGIKTTGRRPKRGKESLIYSYE